MKIERSTEEFAALGRVVNAVDDYIEEKAKYDRIREGFSGETDEVDALECAEELTFEMAMKALTVMDDIAKGMYGHDITLRDAFGK